MTTLEAYARRAEEYTELLGSVEAMAPADVRRIETWARTACGPLLDLGCGPGHWTSHLGALGLDVEGWDPVAEFVRSARDRHPGTVFRRAALADLDGHPGAPAQQWPVGRVIQVLEEAGFEVGAVETRTDPGARPHAAVHARSPH